jgi:hypothetical protein
VTAAGHLFDNTSVFAHQIHRREDIVLATEELKVEQAARERENTATQRSFPLAKRPHSEVQAMGLDTHRPNSVGWLKSEESTSILVL